jgi:parallel beta-helix repeat protein
MTRHLCGVLVAILLATAATVTAATDWYVSNLGNDANNCMSATTACATIQAAVNKASPNDTIHVLAGTYAEIAPGPLTINKTLTLLGAQAGVDARSRGGLESVVTDLQGTSVSASNVVIDGFTFQNSTTVFTGFGIWLNPSIGGTQIVNNIIQNNTVGIGLANSGGSQAVIQHNLIRNNTQPGAASGTGIYTDQFAGGPRVDNVLIDENAFIGHSGTGGAINLSNTDFTNGVFNLQVSSNLFDMNSRAFVLFNTHTSTFDDNTITNSTFAASADIRIFDNNSDLLFTNNDLQDGDGHAVRTSVFFATPSSDLEFHQNNFERYGLTGMTVDPLSHDGNVNATCNWWNSPSGPFEASGNPGGTGEEVVGDADYRPWLIARAPGGPCLGGVPSTAGKATGGGQIGSDPIFSLLGDLISPPALVPSLAGPQSQATFGFVAQCCAPKGNLQYTDHQAGVRIKALSISQFVISSPGTSCPATPGSQHVTFSGSATVTRSTGSTTEPFTVEADDCGEPGTTDTFGIQTTTYANGPSTLVGGNIQIHR